MAKRVEIALLGVVDTSLDVCEELHTRGRVRRYVAGCMYVKSGTRGDTSNAFSPVCGGSKCGRVRMSGGGCDGAGGECGVEGGGRRPSHQ